MSDENDTIDDDAEDGLVPRQHIRALEEKAKRAEELAAKVEAMERLEAFRSAGIDPNDPKARYFVKGYDGDVDPEAIKAAAREAGYLTEPDTQPDLADHQRVAEASKGAGKPVPPNLAEAIARANSVEEVLALVESHPEGLTTRMLQ